LPDPQTVSSLAERYIPDLLTLNTGASIIYSVNGFQTVVGCRLGGILFNDNISMQGRRKMHIQIIYVIFYENLNCLQSTFVGYILIQMC